MSKLIIVGQQGSGKSLLGMFLARKIQAVNPNEITIYTNMNIANNHNTKTVSDLSEIPFDRSPKILVIDEAMFTLDSRSHSSKQNKIWTKAQAFFRKANFLMVVFITHSIDLIDNRMRQQLDYVIMSRKNKSKFDYLIFDMITQKSKPFYLPKEKKIYAYANYNSYDFPNPITVDGLSDDILFKILK